MSGCLGLEAKHVAEAAAAAEAAEKEDREPKEAEAAENEEEVYDDENRVVGGLLLLRGTTRCTCDSDAPSVSKSSLVSPPSESPPPSPPLAVLLLPGVWWR
jgi:hypothetical protein